MAEPKKPSVLRRLVRYGPPAFGVLVCGMGLYAGYCERQTQATLARLRELGAKVAPQLEPYDWWFRVANAVGIPHDQLVPGRRTYTVAIHRPGNAPATLRHVARLPGVILLYVIDAPDCDDAALAQIKNCTSVEVLLLRHTSVTDAGIRNLARWDRLTAVDIAETPVTKATEMFLRGLPSMRSVNVELR